MVNSFASYPSLSGKNILITGGASGIGKEIVKGFAEQGANVAFLDLNDEAGERLSRNIGENVFFEKCDLKEIDNLKSSIEKLRGQIGLFDVLVNNAAQDDRHNWQEVTEDYWDDRFATNLRHQFFTIQSVAKDMIQKGGGSIVNIGSNSWMEAVGNFPAYATLTSAKIALRSAFNTVRSVNVTYTEGSFLVQVHIMYGHKCIFIITAR